MKDVFHSAAHFETLLRYAETMQPEILPALSEDSILRGIKYGAAHQDLSKLIKRISPNSHKLRAQYKTALEQLHYSPATFELFDRAAIHTAIKFYRMFSRDDLGSINLRDNRAVEQIYAYTKKFFFDEFKSISPNFVPPILTIKTPEDGATWMGLSYNIKDNFYIHANDNDDVIGGRDIPVTHPVIALSDIFERSARKEGNFTSILNVLIHENTHQVMSQLSALFKASLLVPDRDFHADVFFDSMSNRHLTRKALKPSSKHYYDLYRTTPDEILAFRTGYVFEAMFKVLYTADYCGFDPFKKNMAANMYAALEPHVTEAAYGDQDSADEIDCIINGWQDSVKAPALKPSVIKQTPQP